MVDCVTLGLRANEFRNAFTVPADIKWPNIESKGGASTTATGDDGTSSGRSSNNAKATFAGQRLIPKDPNLHWDNVIPWLRANTKLPIWLKGRKLFRNWA
jgi:(S)-2-hydroxy-acid oxidase